MTILVLLASGLGAIYRPLLSAMANAHGHGDKRWFRRAYPDGPWRDARGVDCRRWVVAASAGPWLCRVWLHADIGITRTLCTAMAVYFLFWMLSDYHFFVLAGMGKLARLGKFYVLEGMCALLAGGVLVPAIRPVRHGGGTGARYGLLQRGVLAVARLAHHCR